MAKTYTRKQIKGYSVIYIVLGILLILLSSALVNVNETAGSIGGLLGIFIIILGSKYRKIAKNSNDDNISLSPRNKHETVDNTTSTVEVPKSYTEEAPKIYTEHSTPRNIYNVEYINTKAKYPKDFTVLDFETTGLDENEDEIIQVAAIKYRDLVESDRMISYVNPSISIPEFITNLTGITDDDVQGAPCIEEILPKLIEFIGDDVIVAHNAPFDIKFLMGNIEGCKLTFRDIQAVDTVKMSRKYIKSLVNYKLPTLKKHLGIKAKSHLADEDCVVCGAVYIYCYNKAHEKSKAMTI